MTTALFKTRWLLPVNAPPIRDAIFAVAKGKIRHIQTARSGVARSGVAHSGAARSGAARSGAAALPHLYDLGETVVLPAFVNAHSHLELGALQGLPQHGRFTQWIRDLLQAKEGLSREDQIRGLRRAAESLWQSGVHTIADHTSADGPIEEIMNSPLRGRLFVELLGKENQVLSDFSKNKFWTVHPSPHSLHALPPEQLRTFLENIPSPYPLPQGEGERGKVNAPLFSIHLWESDDEHRYFASHDGPLAEFIRSRGMDAKRQDPLTELCPLLPFPLLLVHGNTVTETELTRLDPARHVFVHCPGSHRYFGHPHFPLAMIEKHGFRIALGTDSWASNTSQDFLEELRLFQKNYPEKSPETILRMATLTGAEALGLADKLGSIERGKDAELIGVPYLGGNPHESILKASQVSWHYSRHDSQIPKSSRR